MGHVRYYGNQRSAVPLSQNICWAYVQIFSSLKCLSIKAFNVKTFSVAEKCVTCFSLNYASAL